MIVSLGGCVAVTGGCAAVESVPYPKLGAIKRVKERLLSNEEKEREIRELTLEQKRHREEAEKQLEKR
ncbi:MAG: hypothetical protein Kow0032_25330 [Methyloligellaceae bacterium]